MNTRVLLIIATLIVSSAATDDVDIFKEDDVVEYYKIDFVDWATLVDEKEPALFEEYNQTIQREMEHRRNTLKSKDAVVHRRACTRKSGCSYKLKYQMKLQKAGRQTKQSLPKHKLHGQNQRKSFARPHSEKCARSKRKSAPSHRTCRALNKRPRAYEPETRERISEPDPPEVVSRPPDFDDYYEEYDYERIMKDPCNYEKFDHPLPEIEQNGRRVSDIKCDEYMWQYKIKILDSEIKSAECKYKLKRDKEKIAEVFGGIRAIQGEFPHMGAVGWIFINGSTKYLCGSSLISPRFTLTAAHCKKVPGYKKLDLLYKEPKVVRFGSVFLNDTDNIIAKIYVEDIEIEEFIVREDYNSNLPFYNDIGLIKLKKEIDMKLNIKPACLWTGVLGNEWAANVTGWGQTTHSPGSESSHLMYAEVDFIEKNTCKRYLNVRKNRHWPEGLKDHQLCAGKLQGGMDTCQGDSGGPLQVRNHWTPVPDHGSANSGVVHHVVGITSFGIKCGYQFLPGAYTDITFFLCWVEKIVWPNEKNSYCP